MGRIGHSWDPECPCRNCKRGFDYVERQFQNDLNDANGGNRRRRKGNQRHNRTNTGARFSTGESSHVTINETNDPKAPGGHYISIGDHTGHATAVYNPDGTLADVKANRDWQPRPRQ